MKFKVTYEYRGKVTVDVDARNKEEAEELGIKEADEFITGHLSIYDIEVKPIEKHIKL